MYAAAFCVLGQVHIHDLWPKNCCYLLFSCVLLIVGDKVRVCGADLVTSQQTEALEAARTSYLNIRANGTHR